MKEPCYWFGLGPILGKTSQCHTWLMDWMALDSAAALAMLCHILGELWDAEWRESLSERESIMAYAWMGKEGKRRGHAASSLSLKPSASMCLRRLLDRDWSAKFNGKKIAVHQVKPVNISTDVFAPLILLIIWAFPWLHEALKKALIKGKVPETLICLHVTVNRLLSRAWSITLSFGCYGISPNTTVSFAVTFSTAIFCSF